MIGSEIEFATVKSRSDLGYCDSWHLPDSVIISGKNCFQIFPLKVKSDTFLPQQLSDVEKCVQAFLGAARGAALIRGLREAEREFDPGHPMWRREEEEEDG